MKSGEHKPKGLFDTHCHLDLEPLSSDLGAVLGDARGAGVQGFIVPAVDRLSWDNLRCLSSRHEQVYYAVGLHPAYIDHHQRAHVADLRAELQLRSEACVAIGEVGLDKRFGSQELQLALFEAQLELAAEYSQPVIIHSVGRHNLVAQILKGFPNVSGVIHAFSGSYEQAKAFVDLGLKIGVGPVICRSQGKTAGAVSRLPLGSLLIETDSPDMYLPSSQSKKGEPKDLLVVLGRLAELVGIGRGDLAKILQENCEKLFFSTETREV